MNLTLEQKIGQRLVVGFAGPEITPEFRQLVKDYKIGNVILFKSNIQNKKQVQQLCTQLQQLILQETGYPAFITIDQEGGMVTRLADDATNIAGAMALACGADEEEIYQLGVITAKELKELGINFNLAPDMDINSNPQNPVIGVRSFADTPQLVSKCGIAMIKGLLAGGVLCTTKHFPGHGDTSVDSHLGLPQVNKTMEELEENEFIPFKAAIAAGVPSVMSTHILFPQLEKENVPATMSRTILTDILKNKFGFKGLIISDCMEMQAIQKFYGTVNGVVAAINAGIDLAFVSHTASLAAQACAAIKNAILDNTLSLQEMDSSVQKILWYKEKFAQPYCGNLNFVGCTQHKAFAQTVLQHTITLCPAPHNVLPALGDTPLFISCDCFQTTGASNAEEKPFNFANIMAEKFGAQALVITADPQKREIDALLSVCANHSCVIIGTYNAHLNKGQIEMVNAVAKTGVATLAVTLRNPYDAKYFLKNVGVLLAFEYTQKSIDAVYNVLTGSCPPNTHLSFKL